MLSLTSFFTETITQFSKLFKAFDISESSDTFNCATLFVEYGLGSYTVADRFYSAYVAAREYAFRKTSHYAGCRFATRSLYFDTYHRWGEYTLFLDFLQVFRQLLYFYSILGAVLHSADNHRTINDFFLPQDYCVGDTQFFSNT